MCDHRGGGGDCRCGNYYDDDFPVLPDKPTDIDLSNPNDAIVKHVNIIADESKKRLQKKGKEYSVFKVLKCVICRPKYCIRVQIDDGSTIDVRGKYAYGRVTVTGYEPSSDPIKLF